ncbi:unnamed protein product [Lactuca virosa]|uniref:Uncharacterized protein n=1 Tax=Lactuca virosa TaxID=75947 RepID=A0AAU9LR10_9ASTR|nr:unnamed protein product [Lactuca virosa]
MLDQKFFYYWSMIYKFMEGFLVLHTADFDPNALELAVSTSEALTIHERVGYAFQQIYRSGLRTWADRVLGREVMLKLFSKERDERLKHHLMASKELHPSLISAQSEYKVLLSRLWE